MIIVYGEGRGFRVLWLMEEMGLAYRMRPVDLLGGIEKDTEFLAVNPAGFIPAIVDGETVMVESIAILQYLLARHGPGPLALGPEDPHFPAYLQFLHMGEAGLAGPVNAIVATDILAPEDDKANWTVGWARSIFESRLGLVSRQLAKTPYVAGDSFTAADISVTYALQFAQRTIGYALGETELAYIARTTSRPAYGRAMDACPATKAWVASLNL
ncbi:glutathione S-transferase [Sphingopyxis sp. QXT-31]|uniref:glutathione S-transferase family protein n=1 Tax=Sphingopyxis sp. QXT-31 TaxID=1357916 RepID=UPI00097948AB|nr:glutathione S-transferase family protein [Sphingopyxis sp. QXT-31]APZ98134.1 glutathione S-transferase [Sphingopyxis sp. QXT-31]